ncbi:creatininase family protein [Enterovirga aerilata]|uniref:Creatininase family protein n=1 Tax=Enterovirga aerilata TaxID=2730920 RepID=A0A849ICP8_9HYPH|nr:creatininase family protein [Enterovirga sp. DB1703]NNM75178.1 creatininase family protein [Enterovirga sp. DB1703]
MLWSSLKASELTALAARDAIVVVPLASCENHGPHLATGVDMILVTEVARRAAERASAHRPVVVVPTVWCGLAEMHMSLGGTITVDVPVYYDLLRSICRSIKRQGFKNILLVNGHGGNTHVLNGFVNDFGAELDAAIAVATYWQLAAEAFGTILEDQRNVEHACEGETSMMLTLAPELCDPSEFGNAVGPEPANPSHVEVAGSLAVHRWRSFEARTSHGALGNPTRATAEKGERLLEAAADAIADLLRNDRFWAMSY